MPSMTEYGPHHGKVVCQCGQVVAQCRCLAGPMHGTLTIVQGCESCRPQASTKESSHE